MVCVLTLPVIFLVFVSRNAAGFGFVTSKSKLVSHGRHSAFERKKLVTRSLVTMRDRSSSYWFAPGDQVEVMENVVKASCNLQGRVGVVVESWEKCDVDPTCCCAEQVEVDLAVRVKFLGSERSGNDEGSFEFGFNENELQKVVIGSPIPFDGMTCKAFKIEQMEAQRDALARVHGLPDE